MSKARIKTFENKEIIIELSNYDTVKTVKEKIQ